MNLPTAATFQLMTEEQAKADPQIGSFAKVL